MVQIVLSDQSLCISQRLLLKGLVIRRLEEFLSYLEASTLLGSHGLQIYGEVFRLRDGAWAWAWVSLSSMWRCLRGEMPRSYAGVRRPSLDGGG